MSIATPSIFPSTLDGGGSRAPDRHARTDWPLKHDLFGVQVSATDYDQVVDCLIRAAKQRRPALADFMPVNLLVEGARNPAFRTIINQFDIVAPDGQPVRWALNRFHDARLTDRVYGPFLMKFLCEAAAREKIPIYLYGGTADVLAKLTFNLATWFPELQIAGAHAPPFRPLTPAEDDHVVRRINDSGAGLVFVGIGSPRQEIFAFEHKHAIRAVQLCVGAAFDFHAGVKKMAPPWMQKRGLEWLFRLCSEPGRLWKRYLVTNSAFSYLFARRMVLGW
jgi:N-acetylglucosaminyldiphosphoundecaprenol N-acetyl-beta-D-mannosaminyltransferase